ncbi:valyl-tRNA synthetase [Escherichia coli]
MATFTDKELIKEIKERIGSLDVRDNIERRAYEIALASLEAVPVAWMHSDNGLGIPAITRSKNVADSWLSKGWYVQPLYIAKPVPVVPAVLERLRAIVADPRALPRRKEWVSGQQYSYVLLENVEAMVDEACRAAMLQGDK